MRLRERSSLGPTQWGLLAKISPLKALVMKGKNPGEISIRNFTQSAECKCIAFLRAKIQVSCHETRGPVIFLCWDDDDDDGKSENFLQSSTMALCLGAQFTLHGSSEIAGLVFRKPLCATTSCFVWCVQTAIFLLPPEWPGQITFKQAQDTVMRKKDATA